MWYPKITRVINLIKKCSTQPILFQKLYCHLSWIILNEYKNVNIENLDILSSIVVYGALRKKLEDKEKEKIILSYINIIKKRKFLSSDETFGLQIIICYFYNLDSKYYNFSLLAELLHNFLGKNDITDYLIIKYFNKSHLSSLFNGKIKFKMYKSVVEDFLVRFVDKEISIACKIIMLPNYCLYEIKPMCFNFEIVPDEIKINLIESFCFYAKFTKSPEFVKEIMPSDPSFLEYLGKFINMEPSENNFDDVVKSNVEDFYLEDETVFDYILKYYNKSVDPHQAKKKLKKFIHNLS